MLIFILFLLLGGLIIGSLARLAVPGPDPMPIWMTIALGLAGSILGGFVARLVLGSAGGFLFSVLGAVALVVAYRKYQGRPITGPAARRPPR
jgi:uncharacterized membrane protein YeaQ/YmgE (transglycosylase-associated protein family)